MSRRTTSDRARQALSYGLSLVLHLLLILTVTPCVPELPTLIRVQRWVPEVRLEATSETRGEAEAAVDAAEQRAGSLALEDEPDRAADRPDGAPEREPEREPDEVPEDGDRTRIVHTSEAGARPEEAEAESRFDQQSEERRAPVTDVDEGPQTPTSPESVALREARGEQAAAAAPTASGGAATGARERAPSAPASSEDGLPVGEPPSWWQPRVSRLQPAPAQPEEVDDMGAGSADEGSEEAIEPEASASDPSVVPDETDRPGVEPAEADPVTPRVDDADADAGEAVADAAVEGETRDGSVPTWQSAATESASHQTVADGPESDAPAVSARATVRGAWLQQVDEVVRKRWHSQELPMHLQGIGVRGTTTVRFTIAPSGRTSEVTVIRRSGNAWLDALAREAIPARVPRMPRELPEEPVSHEIRFEY